MRRKRSALGQISTRFAAVWIAALVALAPIAAEAQTRLPLVRDAEIEALIRDYSLPLFKVSGISASNIQIYLIRSSAFNAFVADGRRMFINTGAIMQSDTPNQLIGVIAHETGHIAGGHLARLRDQLARTRTASIIAMLAGAAAAVAVGAAGGSGSDAVNIGRAAVAGGTQATQRSFLEYRRSEEIAADRAAINYLNATGQSGKGMLEVFDRFAGQAIFSGRYTDPYVQSHPLPRDRVATLEQLVRSSPYYNSADPASLVKRHNMVRAKLHGFLDNPRSVMRRYPRNDASLPARYARAIARFRTADLRAAIRDIDGLIRAEPRNPYFRELKGQALLESGRATEAIKPLQDAVSLAPNEPLIRIMLGHALVATNSRANMEAAIGHLRKGLAAEPDHGAGFRQLSIAYGRTGREGEAALAAARGFLAQGAIPLARQQATRAQALLKRGSPGWIQADDLLNVTKREK